jgi:hypothetical protein
MASSSEGEVNVSGTVSAPKHKPVRTVRLKPGIVPLRNVRLLEIVALVALTGALDYLIYQGVGGLSYAIAILAIPLVVLVAAPVKRWSAPLFFVLTLLLTLAARFAWQFQPFSLAIGVAVLFAFAIIYRSGRAYVPFLAVSMLPTGMIGIVRCFQYFVPNLQNRKHTVFRRRVDGTTVAVIAVPLGIVLTFAVVFLLSNPILRDVAGRNWDPLWAAIRDVYARFAPTPERSIFWAACVVFLASMLRPALVRYRGSYKWRISEVTPSDVPSESKLAYRMAMNTLLGVNLLFIAYNVIDARYLVVLRELPSGLDHSQYAHQGVFWLTVALAMSTCVLGTIFSGVLHFHQKAGRLKALAHFWVLQNLLIAVWVMLRLHMYIDYNGLTRMRIVGIYGTLLVLCGLVLVAVMILRKRSIRWLLRKELAALAIAIIALAVTPLDWIAWTVNTPLIQRMIPPRPAVQLSVQPISAEGLMTLIPLLDHDDPVIAAGVAGLLGEWYSGYERYETQRYVPPARWTEYQLSEELCARAIALNMDRIRALIPDGNWGAALERLKAHTARWI